MHRIGIAGFGFMGQMHFRAYRDVADAEVTALFDADPTVFEKKPAEGNIEAGDLGSLEGIEKHGDFEKFLASDVDVVDLCVPTGFHRELVERALAAGHAVLCEKPMALTVEDCDAMIEAARKADLPLMVAQCVRFWPGYDLILEAVRTGKYGRPLAATFRRVGGAPVWSNWFLDASRSGGGIVDCMVHDFDFVRGAFGMPGVITASGNVDVLGAGSGVSYSRTDLDYGADGPCVTVEGGWLIGPTYPFSMTAFVQFEQGTLAFGMEPGVDLVIHHKEGKKEIPELRAGQGYAWELRYFLESLAEKKPLELCPPEESRDAIRMALAAQESIQTRKPVRP